MSPYAAALDSLPNNAPSGDPAAAGTEVRTAGPAQLPGLAAAGLTVRRSGQRVTETLARRPGAGRVPLESVGRHKHAPTRAPRLPPSPAVQLHFASALLWLHGSLPA